MITSTSTRWAGRGAVAITKASNWSVKDTQYDNVGRVWKVSNPYTTSNLTGALKQGTQYRYFLYESLSRLLRARNPEQSTASALDLTPPSDQSTGNTSWALKYIYDSNGNLTSKEESSQQTTS